MKGLFPLLTLLGLGYVIYRMRASSSQAAPAPMPEMPRFQPAPQQVQQYDRPRGPAALAPPPLELEKYLGPATVGGVGRLWNAPLGSSALRLNTGRIL